MRSIFICCLFIFSLGGISQTLYVSNLNAQGNGSLREVIANAPSGATIKFNPSLLDNGSQTLVLDSNIVIDKDLTLKGLFNETDSIFISGNNSTRIFQILNVNHVILDSLILENTSIIGDGGALYIYNTNLVNLNNCIIRNCSANNGGGIYGYTGFTSSVGDLSTRLHLVNTLINNNSASNNGGGIYYYHVGASPKPDNNQDIIPKRIQLNYSTISNNTAANQGGGIYHFNTFISMSYDPETITRHSALEIDMNGCTVYNNQAYKGGAIYNQIKSTHLKEIKQLPGPADHYLTTKINFINSTLSENTAVLYPEIYSDSKKHIGSQKIIDTNLVTFGSSIVNSTQQNAIEIGSTNSINSLGYNIFTDSLLNGYLSTDFYGVTPTEINLGALNCYGDSKTPNLQPQLPSIAINNGNPNDNRLAQTGYLFGRRDIGSSETCKSFSLDTRTEYDEIQWIDGNTYTSDNSTATYSTTNTHNCDSVIFLKLEIIPLPVMSIYPNPTIQNQDISLTFNTLKNYNVQLTDLQGRTIKTYHVKPTSKTQTLRISELQLNPGIYFMNNSHSKQSIKLIVL